MPGRYILGSSQDQMHFYGFYHFCDDKRVGQGLTNYLCSMFDVALCATRLERLALDQYLK